MTHPLSFLLSENFFLCVLSSRRRFCSDMEFAVDNIFFPTTWKILCYFLRSLWFQVTITLLFKLFIYKNNASFSSGCYQVFVCCKLLHLHLTVFQFLLLYHREKKNHKIYSRFDVWNKCDKLFESTLYSVCCIITS